MSLIKNIALGWFCFCYAVSLLLLPIFPFITTGFDWRIAAAIIFLSPVLYVFQGVVIGAMVWGGLCIYAFIEAKFKLVYKNT